MKRDDFSNPIIIEALEKNNGFLQQTAASLIDSEGNAVHRSTLYRWIYGDKRKGREAPEDPELIQAVLDARESTLDKAESKLLDHIEDGDVTSLIFYLKTQGKKRGYVERIENEVFIEQPLFDDGDDEDEEFPEDPRD